jgi:hypothetical protein
MWEYICILKGSKAAHHKKSVNMAMRLPDGSLAASSTKNMSVFGPHFERVFSNHHPVDFSVLDLIPQKEQSMEIDHPITFAEVDKAINKLKSGKVPGLNGNLPEAYKAMGKAMQLQIHPYVGQFFDGKMGLQRMAQESMCPCPKKGDLANPNKWRGVMFMDVCSKIFSSVMNNCAFRLMELHGTCFQFVGTPKLGCRDSLFTLKALLNARRNHNLGSYVGFVDLVKAYDTANNGLLFCLLEKYGAPLHICCRGKKNIYRQYCGT